MGYKIYESDKFGKLAVYPSLYPPRRKRAFVNLFEKIMKVFGRHFEKVRISKGV